MQRQDNDNLVSVLAILALAATIGFAVQLSQNAPVLSYSELKQYDQTPVQGYTRPKSSYPLNPAKKMQSQMEAQNKIDVLHHLSDEQKNTLIQRFEQAVALLHAKQYDYAVMAIEQVIALQPRLPEAYVNLGYAYFGLKQYKAAQNAFEKAIDLRPFQANAYYGLAEVLEARREFEAALGAMRSFIHLSQPDNPYLPKARAALWEWEGILGRIEGVAEAPDGGRPQMLLRPSPHKRDRAKSAEKPDLTTSSGDNSSRTEPGSQ